MSGSWVGDGGGGRGAGTGRGYVQVPGDLAVVIVTQPPQSRDTVGSNAWLSIISGLPGSLPRREVWIHSNWRLVWLPA